MQNRKTIQNAYTEKFSEPNARNDGISETSSLSNWAIASWATLR